MTIRQRLEIARALTRFALVAALGGACAQPLFAEGRSPGQTVVYELTQVSTNNTDFSSLPAMVRGRAAANQAAANGKKMTTRLTLTTDQVDADSNAHVNGTYHRSMEGLSGIPATALSATQKFQGTLTADGRLLPTYDPGMPATPDAHGMYSEAVTQNIHAQEMQGTFVYFNTFVTGISKHPRLKSGDAWRVVIQDTYGISQSYDFSVSAPSPETGSDASVVTMTGDFSGPGSSSKVSAMGHYDPVRRLVVDFHQDNTYASTTPNGISTSGVASTDIRLQP
jgi:hypothetical protein